MTLIDKDKVAAEIEKLIDEIYAGRPFDSLSSEQQAALWYVKSIMSSINTLEVKEINFKDIKSVFEGQYLSKDKIVTTIEMLQDECEEQGDNNGVELLEKLFNKLDALEVKGVEGEELDKLLDWWKERTTEHSCQHVKDVDLEKEIGKYLDTNDVEFIHQIKLLDFAKHFYELGLKEAKKGE